MCSCWGNNMSLPWNVGWFYLFRFFIFPPYWISPSMNCLCCSTCFAFGSENEVKLRFIILYFSKSKWDVVLPLLEPLQAHGSSSELAELSEKLQYLRGLSINNNSVTSWLQRFSPTVPGRWGKKRNFSYSWKTFLFLVSSSNSAVWLTVKYLSNKSW